MQGGPADRDPSDVDGLQKGHGGEFSRPSHLNPDLLDHGFLLPRRELVGHGPAGVALADAEVLPYRPFVDLDDGAVDLERKLVPAGGHLVAELDYLIDVGGLNPFVVNGKPPVPEPVHDAPLRVGEVPGGRQQIEHVQIERPAGGNLRIELTQRARRGVPGVGEGILPLRHPAFVQLLEGIQAHKNFSPDHQFLGQGGIPGQLKGKATDRPEVVGDVLPADPVPPGGTAFEPPLPVGKGHRQSVKLAFGKITEVVMTELIPEEAVEVPNLVFLQRG